MILSIVIIGRNDAQHLARSLGTAISQKTDEVEVVFVDDASTDTTFSTAAKIADGKSNVQVLHSETNVGIGGARNLGVSKAHGDYIYFHDSDDYLTDGAVSRIVEALTNFKGIDTLLVPFRVLNNGSYKDHVPLKETTVENAVGWAVGAWSAVFKRSLYVPTPEKVYAEDVVWHFLQYDKFNSAVALEGSDPVYVWDCTNPTSVTRTVEWFWNKSYTLEQLAFTNVLVNAGLKDIYVSDTLRNLAALYDVRHQLKKPWVKEAWAKRFSSCYQRIMTGHFGH